MKTSWNTREDYLIKAKQLLRQGSLQEAITEARKVLTPDRNPKIPPDQKFISKQQIKRAIEVIDIAIAQLNSAAYPQTSSPNGSQPLPPQPTPNPLSPYPSPSPSGRPIVIEPR